MNKEVWRDIVGYEGLYIVSDFGNVKSVNNIGNSFKLTPDRFGYTRINLCKYKSSKKVRVHRLVALAFIPNPENKPYVNHLNGIKTDNRAENLAWCTAKENSRHAHDTGLVKNKKYHGQFADHIVGINNASAKLTEGNVIEIINMLCNNVKPKEIANIFNVTRTTIYDIKTGKRWSHLTGIEFKEKQKIITNNEAIEILDLIKQGVKASVISKMFNNLCQNYISRMKCGKAWANLSK